MLEKEIMKSVYQRLSILRMTGEVINFHRLNSGKVQNIHTGSWINLGEKDTPDWVVLIRNRNDAITVLYIECKSSTGKVREGQTQFINKYGTKEGVFVMILRNIRDLDVWILKNAKCFVSCLPTTL